MIAENGYSLVKINNAAYKAFKLALRELTSGAITAQNLIDVERLYLLKFRLFSHRWISSELTNSLCRLVLKSNATSNQKSAEQLLLNMDGVAAAMNELLDKSNNITSNVQSAHKRSRT